MEFVFGKPVPKHNHLLCKTFEDAMERKPGCLRIMGFQPPGTAKTVTLSWHAPAFYLSKFPDHNVIAATHTDKFANQNGRRVRNIMMSDEHRALFPEITISEDSSAAERWETTKGGTYAGFGVGATVVGRRADLIIMDDVVAGIAAADSEAERNAVWDWYGNDLLTRLKPDGIIVLVMTRYHLDDLAGRLIAAEKNGGDKWKKVILPALAKKNDPLGRKEGEALWPEWQSREALLKIQANPAMSSRMWSALYQQEPVPEGGGKIKRDWFKIWNSEEIPKMQYKIQTWDTAISKKDKSAYSCCLTWGIFNDPETELPSLFLMSRWRGRVEYPDLRKMAVRLSFNYLDDNMELPQVPNYMRKPDIILIEEKATGKPLIADLRHAGVDAIGFNPNRYGDKDARLMLCMDIFENGRVWVPGQRPNYTRPRKWAEEYINSMISFPSAESRDDVDASSQAIIWLKRSGWVYNSADPRDPGYTQLGPVHRELYG